MFKTALGMFLLLLLVACSDDAALTEAERPPVVFHVLDARSGVPSDWSLSTLAAKEQDLVETVLGRYADPDAREVMRRLLDPASGVTIYAAEKDPVVAELVSRIYAVRAVMRSMTDGHPRRDEGEPSLLLKD